MLIEIPQSFWLYFIFFVLLMVDGLWCMLATRNLLRILIGLEVLMKSVTFFLIVAGYLSGRMALAPSATGSMPAIMAIVVIRIGRSRTGPALRSAASRGRPSRSRSVLV